MRSLIARICDHWYIGNQIRPITEEAMMPMTKIGTRLQFMPRARMVTAVVIRFTEATPVEKANTMMSTW